MSFVTCPPPGEEGNRAPSFLAPFHPQRTLKAASVRTKPDTAILRYPLASAPCHSDWPNIERKPCMSMQYYCVVVVFAHCWAAHSSANTRNTYCEEMKYLLPPSDNNNTHFLCGSVIMPISCFKCTTLTIV